MPQTKKQKTRRKLKMKAKRPNAVQKRADKFVAGPRGRAKSSTDNWPSSGRSYRYS